MELSLSCFCLFKFPGVSQKKYASKIILDVIESLVLRRVDVKRGALCTLLLSTLTIGTALAQNLPPEIIPEKVLNKRIEYFSKKMQIPIQEAAKAVAITDKSIENSNRIYNDTTLSSTEKVKQLSLIEKDTDLKMKALIPDLESRRKKSLQSNKNNLKLKKHK